MKPAKLLTLFAILPPAAALALSASRTIADPDLWGHVRFGLDMLAARAIPRVDPYSFTSDRVWINHEWLAEVIMAAAYQAGGGAGLLVLKLAVVIATFGVLWRAVRVAGVYLPAASALALVAILGASPLWQTVRPQLFSLVLFATMAALLNAIGRGRHALFGWMPLLFMAWANTHGGWLVGLGVVGVWSGGHALAGRLPWRWAVGGPIGALAGTLVTPYGHELWVFLWETVRVARPDITEWRPITDSGHMLFIWAVVSIPAFVAWRRSGMAGWPVIATSAVVGLLAWRVGRLQGFFALTNVVILAPCFAAYGPARFSLSRLPSRRDLAVVSVLCVAGLAALGAGVRKQASCISMEGGPGLESWEPEPESIGFFAANALRGRLLSYFNWGEMAIWYLAPDLLVSYDGRRETVYSPAIQQAHLRFYSKTPDPAFARSIGADYIWLPHRLAVVPMLARDGWVELYRGRTSVVLGRAPEAVRQPRPWNGPRCFPGP